MKLFVFYRPYLIEEFKSQDEDKNKTRDSITMPNQLCCSISFRTLIRLERGPGIATRASELEQKPHRRPSYEPWVRFHGRRHQDRSKCRRDSRGRFWQSRRLDRSSHPRYRWANGVLEIQENNSRFPPRWTRRTERDSLGPREE